MPEYKQREFNDRDWQNHYFKHVNAMTAEGLHSKSDIAAELAFRDSVVERYRAALEQIKLYHENIHGAKASTFIAYDIACKALEEV